MRRAVSGAVLLVILLAACATGVDGARQALTNTDQLLSASAMALEKFDPEWERHLVDIATDRASAQKALADYRAKRAVAVRVMTDAGAVLATGPALIALVELGVKKSSDLAAWLTQLEDAMLKVSQALAALGVHVPGV